MLSSRVQKCSDSFDLLFGMGSAARVEIQIVPNHIGPTFHLEDVESEAARTREPTSNFRPKVSKHRHLVTEEPKGSIEALLPINEDEVSVIGGEPARMVEENVPTTLPATKHLFHEGNLLLTSPDVAPLKVRIHV